ncbi:unannotated protein [freshwater metagenome]|uniref:Unannotated protein n=1 Tax=freshwater metagenome TaxID=449393 RepID=A0A6J7EVQ0_9ZZZZ|nr:hypothetical protein [Actinomycetota bacterium]
MRKIIATAVIAAFGFAGIAPAIAADAATVALTGGGKAVVNTMPDSLVATTNSAGLVEYKADGITIAGCEKVATTTVTPFKATCTWLPTVASKVSLSAIFTPTDTTVAAVTSAAVVAAVGSPTQGVVSPINIYADTVLASGSTGVLAPRFSACAVQSEYLLGQKIVFRVYGNNADLGGAVMDNTNTAKAYIEVAGVKDPIPLAYGNHSGISFWTAVLATGTAVGQYSTLGVINYKVTMVAKDITVAKVLGTKRVAKTVDGKTTWEWVSYYKNKKLTWPIKGATGTLVPNWTATSLLTLYAAPVAK